MERSIPAWVLLLFLLLGVLLAVAFGWSVKSTMAGTARFERFGKLSLAIASFPELIGRSFEEIVGDGDAFVRVPRARANLSDFDPIRMKPSIHVQGLLVRADQAGLARSIGWRMLVGTFVIDGQLEHAAIALSPELEIVRVWVLREDDIQGQRPQSQGRKHPHGFALLKDGSMIFTFDAGVSIQRFDQCGNRIWATGGIFDHTVSPTDDEKFVWTVRNHDYPPNDTLAPSEVMKVAVASGEITQRFSMAEIAAANPTIGILSLFEGDRIIVNGNPPNETAKWWSTVHINDVEPLPAVIAGRSPSFTAGDLLVSARTLNLVFVVDPGTLKVKWWKSGVAWRRQHDPDWQPSGELSIYDNRGGRDYSRIVSVDPASERTRIVFDGRANGFYSHIRGKHQITRVGNILIASPQQGRVFEVDRDGQPVFEIINTKPESKDFNYLISEAMWLPVEAYDFEKDLLCTDSA